MRDNSRHSGPRPPFGAAVWFTCTGVLAVLLGVFVAWAAWPRAESSPNSATTTTTLVAPTSITIPSTTIPSTTVPQISTTEHEPGSAGKDRDEPQRNRDRENDGGKDDND